MANHRTINGQGELDSSMGYVSEGISLDVLAAISEDITEAERVEVLKAGREFSDAASFAQYQEQQPGGRTDGKAKNGGTEENPDAEKRNSHTEQISTPCLLISGQLGRYYDQDMMVENRVMKSCMDVFGYPSTTPDRTINLLLDSTGGMLDSAFKVIRYLSWYASKVNVYVPRHAKSAGTLIAVGADWIYLSPPSELGPLDTQILDPRNPTKPMSALDCYLSIDYVRQFGYQTLSSMLTRLVKEAGGQIPLSELLSTASQFSVGSIEPMLQRISPLDFGAWGRSLKVGERYASLLLEARNYDRDRSAQIASTLVYGYTHHPFPIDHREAERIGLNVKVMEEQVFHKACKVIKECNDKSFVGFISKSEADQEDAERREDVRQRVGKTPARSRDQTNGSALRKKRQVNAEESPAALIPPEKPRGKLAAADIPADIPPDRPD